jgi:cell fate (sporulation/competence/biofilm development) regulator YmcA (YheA/YmcA/DUF963 family)
MRFKIKVYKMAENQIHILIFKTNIRTEKGKQLLKDELKKHPSILEWHVDQEDVDCVLRIVSSEYIPEKIIECVTMNGYNCAELQ